MGGVGGGYGIVTALELKTRFRGRTSRAVGSMPFFGIPTFISQSVPHGIRLSTPSGGTCPNAWGNPPAHARGGQNSSHSPHAVLCQYVP